MTSMASSELFDIFVALAPQRELSVKLPNGGLWQQSVGFAGLALSLDDCRRLLVELRSAQGNGLVLDPKYRNFRIDVNEARRLAGVHLDTIRATTADEFGLLGEVEDGGAWWTFRAPNLTLQAQDVLPGVRTISIDKLDGHVLNAGEKASILKLSAP